MPELPEVQTVVNCLAPIVQGKIIQSIDSPNHYDKVFENRSAAVFRKLFRVWRLFVYGAVENILFLISRKIPKINSLRSLIKNNEMLVHWKYISRDYKTGPKSIPAIDWPGSGLPNSEF